MAGTLFVVATPIGNLEDLSFRALRTLKEVDLIAAEDTRRTAKLLAHYAIRKSMVSLREHNERRETPKLLDRLRNGSSIALVSDAGTPGVSDPGQHLVRSAREAGITVSPIPGPSAVMAALSASGEAGDEFAFMGFIPRSGALRSRWLEALSAEARTVIFFEAPHRIERLLPEIGQLLVDRPIHVFKELTKINEFYAKCTNTTGTPDINLSGEFVIVVGKTLNNKADSADDPDQIALAVRMFDCLTNNNSFPTDEALKLTAAATSVDESVVRKAAKKSRIARKRQEESLS
jgi:16S rRNA (cytidine1402-2'-O)-methyltransferase